MLQVQAGAIPQERPGKKEAALLAGSLFVIVGSYAYSAFAGSWSALAPRCLFHWITKTPCLLCGMTRSFAATARLDLKAAFTYHYLGPVFFLAVWVIAAASAWSLLTGKRLRLQMDTRTRKLLGWGLLAVIVVAWVAKLVILGRNV